MFFIVLAYKFLTYAADYMISNTVWDFINLSPDNKLWTGQSWRQLEMMKSVLF